MLKHLVKFQTSRDERGATAVEYGLMVALIAVVIIGAVTALGTDLTGLFDHRLRLPLSRREPTAVNPPATKEVVLRVLSMGARRS